MSRFSQPNFTILGPDGSVLVTFPGGVDMLQATAVNNPVQSRRIAWKRESDGKYLAYIADDAVGQMMVKNSGTEVGNLDLQAAFIDPAFDVFTSPAVGYSNLRVQADTGIGAPPPPSMAIFADIQEPPIGINPQITKYFIAGDGASDFVQLANTIPGGLSTPGTVCAVLGFGAGISVAALAAAATQNINGINTNIPMTYAGRNAAGFRISIAIQGNAGSQLGWGYTAHINTDPVTYDLQFRNNSAAASVATTATPIIIVTYA